MKTELFPAKERGFADHGWLKSYHSFSFASYYDPGRMHFGMLRVLNDDHVEAGMGFGTHPHDNMEIISIPLEGELEHRDSMGNVSVIRSGDIQIMSAGTGVTHSEYNRSKTEPVKFLQIWVFPKVRNTTPSYDQIHLNEPDLKNVFKTIVSPDGTDGSVQIKQNAWFHLGKFEPGLNITYKMRSQNNGLYIFVLSGSIEVAEILLSKRDALGIWDTEDVNFNISDKSKILLMEVPMQ